MVGKVIGIIIAVAIFALFITNTDFPGMSFQEIMMVLRIYAVVAGILGGILTVSTGVNILSGMFLGTAVLAIAVSLLSTISC